MGLKFRIRDITGMPRPDYVAVSASWHGGKKVAIADARPFNFFSARTLMCETNARIFTTRYQGDW
jgi:hypothetical protein